MQNDAPHPAIPRTGRKHPSRKSKTLEDRLIAADGRPSGFDYMRFGLALCIVVYHSVMLAYGQDAGALLLRMGLRPVAVVTIPMFFALSGFLVAGSLERSKTLITFFGLRALRIVPALFVDTAFCALVLGPLFTELPLKSYFSSSQLYVYFLNIVGDIHYRLPGLFHYNPHPDIVNGQLWTVPFELGCYVLLGGLTLLGIFRRRNWLLGFMGCVYAFQVYTVASHFQLYASPVVTDISVKGSMLVIIFIAGVLIYRFRDRIPCNAGLFLAATALTFLLLEFPFIGDRFIAIPVAYLTVYIGLMNPKRDSILLSGDYSYGMYLYSYPLQQVISMIGQDVQQWYWNALVSMPLIIIVTTASWWLVEKPALRLRSRLKKLEAWYTALPIPDFLRILNVKR